MERDADITPDGVYRYVLTRYWDRGLRPLIFCMLNPSVADGDTDDPTVTRCIGFARSLGFGGIRVINLFEYIATNPLELLAHPKALVIGDKKTTRCFST